MNFFLDLVHLYNNKHPDNTRQTWTRGHWRLFLHHHFLIFPCSMLPFTAVQLNFHNGTKVTATHAVVIVLEQPFVFILTI